MLRTKCILKPRMPDDGVIISVMSRHTLNDGKTPDTRIVEGVNYDEYEKWKPLRPNGALVGWWYRQLGELERGEFTEAQKAEVKAQLWRTIFTRDYLCQFEDPVAKNMLIELARQALTENRTVVCIENTPEYCHRRLLAENARVEVPGLEIRHL
jgi:hypothetical protein